MDNVTYFAAFSHGADPFFLYLTTKETIFTEKMHLQYILHWNSRQSLKCSCTYMSVLKIKSCPTRTELVWPDNCHLRKYSSQNRGDETEGPLMVENTNSIISVQITRIMSDWSRLNIQTSSPYATSFRRRFFAYHHAMTHPHSNIILSLFSIPLVLKCAAKILKIGSQVKI